MDCIGHRDRKTREDKVETHNQKQMRKIVIIIQ